MTASEFFNDEILTKINPTPAIGYNPMSRLFEITYDLHQRSVYLTLCPSGNTYGIYGFCWDEEILKYDTYFGCVTPLDPDFIEFINSRAIE